MPNGNRVEQDVSTTGLYDDHCRTGLDVLARALKALGDRLTGLRIYKVSCDADFGNYIVNEVVKDVDSSYRTDGERYIGGFSVGGRGALQLSVANGGVFDGGFGLSGSYDFLRKAMRNKDQRGLYGELGTFLFHKDLAGLGVEHLYCTYDGTHSDMAWVAAMPQALRYLLGAEDAPRQDRGDALSCSAR